MTRTASGPASGPAAPMDASAVAALRRAVAPFEGSDDACAWRTVATSLPPFVALWGLMYAARGLPYGVTLALAVPAAGFLVRTFIVAHDCGHGAFFRAARTNRWMGRLCALPALVPFGWWRRMHAVHHATSGKLDHRGMDIATLTVREYEARTATARLGYRLLRHPVVLFGLAPALYFGVAMRLPWLAPAAWRRERRGILLTNAALALVVALLVHAVGWRTFLRIQLPVSLLAWTVGMWLFFVQHQFEDTYWAHDGEWEQGRASLAGASHLDLPPLLAWFTGYIGLHHVHHLSPRVPSYRLAACVAAVPALRDGPRLALGAALGTWRHALWDEGGRRLVGFAEAAARDQAHSPTGMRKR